VASVSGIPHRTSGGRVDPRILVQEIGVQGIAYTNRSPARQCIQIPVQFGHAVFDKADVESRSPVKTGRTHRIDIDLEFYPLVFHFAYIAADLCVTTGPGDRLCQQQILADPSIHFYTTIDSPAQYGVIKTDIGRRIALPPQVRV